MHRFTILFALAVAPAAVAQATWLVPGHHPTIQAAVTAAANNDIILVAPGTYVENVDMLGKDLVVRSLAGPALTTIDGGGLDATVLYPSGSTRAARLEGFTITNGNNMGSSTAGVGGGIKLVASSPTIIGCVVRGNRTIAYGGGIGGTDYGGGGNPIAPRIENCVIEDNAANGVAYASGGGIALTGFSAGAVASTPEIVGCIVRRNTASTRGGGMYFGYNVSAVVDGNQITQNTTGGTSGALDGGAGIFCALNAAVTIVNNRIWANVSTSNGGGVKYFNVTGVQIINNTIIDNAGGGIAGFATGTAFGLNVSADVVNCIVRNPGGLEFALTGTDQNGQPPSVTVRHSDVLGGHPGVGNFDLPPMLLNAGSGNHRLTPGSPCFNTGDAAYPGVPTTDFDGDSRPAAGAVDVGADEFDPNGVLLWSNVATVSTNSPTNIVYSIAGGSSRAGSAFVVLFSLSGTVPGVDLLGMHVPLNPDPFTTAISFVNGGLNAGGDGSATFPLGGATLHPALVGTMLSSAAVIVGPGGLITDFTNDENVVFVP